MGSEMCIRDSLKAEQAHAGKAVGRLMKTLGPGDRASAAAEEEVEEAALLTESLQLSASTVEGWLREQFAK